jgi:hypothetical protein
LKRWPYYSRSVKEKLNVFFCCAKPSSANRWPVLDSYSTQGVALTELKMHEAKDSSDSSLAIEPVAERKLSGDFESRVLSLLEEQNKATAATFETMSVRIKMLSEKIDSSESNPLLQQGQARSSRPNHQNF